VNAKLTFSGKVNSVLILLASARIRAPGHSLGEASMSTAEPKHRILVVEDEAMVSMLLEDMVLDCGGEIIGPVARFETALALAQAAEFDVAVLDLNLSGTLSYPIAEAIRGRGIPVIFATGYGSNGLRDGFRDCPTLQKPFSQSDFAQAVAAACDLSSIRHNQRAPSDHAELS
jgi:CheY-like chemotaxis protein